MGLPVLHHEALRLDAGRVVLLHVPDIGVPPPLHLLLGLVDCPAEAVVHLLVDAVLGLVPDQVGHAVDGGLQIVAGLPELGGLLAALLPALEAEAQLLFRQGRGPNIAEHGQGQVGGLLLAAQDDQLRILLFAAQQLRRHFLRLPRRQIGQDQVRLRRQGMIRRAAG